MQAFESIQQIERITVEENIFSFRLKAQIGEDELDQGSDHTNRKRDQDILEAVLETISEEMDFFCFQQQMKKVVEQKLQQSQYTDKKEQLPAVFLLIFRLFLKKVLYFLSYLLFKITPFKMVAQLQSTSHYLAIHQFKDQSSRTLQIYFKSRSFTNQLPQSSSHQHPKEEKMAKQQGSWQASINKYVIKLAQEASHTQIISNENFCFYLLHREKEDKLGQGGFGMVLKAESVAHKAGRYCQRKWAVKELKRQMNRSSDSGIAADREYQILHGLKQLPTFKSNPYSKNIIDIHEVISDIRKQYFIYELCPYKDLSKFIHSKKSELLVRATKKHIFLIIYNLLATLSFIHYQVLTRDNWHLLKVFQDGEVRKDQQRFSLYHNYQQLRQMGIIHRDIKPSNIVIKEFNDHFVSIKIIDWAFSKKTITETKFNSLRCGTDHYQAPEFDKKGEQYCCKVDVWAFAMTVFQLLTGKPMISKNDERKIVEEKKKAQDNVSHMKFSPDKEFSQEQQKIYRQLLSHCLAFKAEDRWSSKKAFEFLRNNQLYKPLTSKDLLYIRSLKILRMKIIQAINQLLNPNRRRINASIIKLGQIVTNALLFLCEKELSSKYPQTEHDLQQLRELAKQKQEFKELLLPLSNRRDSQVNDRFQEQFRMSRKLLDSIKPFSDVKAVAKFEHLLSQVQKEWESAYK